MLNLPKILLLFLAFCKISLASECWVHGRCKGYLVDLNGAASQEKCLEHCKDLPNCKWFTYDQAQKYCATYSQCTNLDESCTTCVSGEQKCPVSDFTYNF